MSIGAKAIMLFDAGKMFRTSFVQFAPLEAVDTIVTDAIGAEEHVRLEKSSIGVLVAG
jgi:DeoR/GlpR family transcriptional regulator of sugar metabolism